MLTRAPANDSLAGRAADDRAGLEHERAQAGPGEVGRGDEPVVAAADDDGVVVGARRAADVLVGRARRVLTRAHLGRPVASAPCPPIDTSTHLRAPDIARCLSERSIVVQPLGAIEQHGPHLPFNTDLLIAERVATAAVERVGDELDVWLLPPLAYTKSNEHAWSPGTVWLSASTLLAVLDDLGRCVAMTPARGSCSSTATAATARSSTSPTASCACTTG